MFKNFKNVLTIKTSNLKIMILALKFDLTTNLLKSNKIKN